MNEDQGGPVEETRQWTATDQGKSSAPVQSAGPQPIQDTETFRQVMLAANDSFRSLPVVTFDAWAVVFNYEVISRGFKEIPESIVLSTFRGGAMKLLREQMMSSWGYADVQGDTIRAWVPAELLIEANARAEKFRAVLQAAIQGLMFEMQNVEKEQAYRGVPLAQGDKAGGAMAMNQAKVADLRATNLARQTAAANPGTSAGRQYFPAEGEGPVQVGQGQPAGQLQPSIAGARGLR
jgi:hypothetical protein